MKGNMVDRLVFSIFFILLSGCSPIGSKTTSLSIIYGAAAALSLLLLVGYCLFVRRRDTWFLLLFSSVPIVNIGYLALSISRSLEEALLANRIAYLGSVFLPMSMLMSILGVTKIKYKKWVPVFLLGISGVVFLIAASPGYLDIYYSEVSLEIVNGVAVLGKVYGPWHSVYLFYLLGYLATMIAVVRYATVKKKVASSAHAALLTIAVLVNIGVWFIEQLVKIDFEFLSVSYIISEIFLLSVHLIIQDNEAAQNQLLQNMAAESIEDAPAAEDETDEEGTDAFEAAVKPAAKVPDLSEVSRDQFLYGLTRLTKTERAVYGFYLEGKTTKEIIATLGIKENTLKFHNKNLYGKLGVTSRKQLTTIHRQIEAEKEACMAEQQ